MEDSPDHMAIATQEVTPVCLDQELFDLEHFLDHHV